MKCSYRTLNCCMCSSLRVRFGDAYILSTTDNNDIVKSMRIMSGLYQESTHIQTQKHSHVFHKTPVRIYIRKECDIV